MAQGFVKRDQKIAWNGVSSKDNANFYTQGSNVGLQETTIVRSLYKIRKNKNINRKHCNPGHYDEDLKRKAVSESLSWIRVSLHS